MKKKVRDLYLQAKGKRIAAEAHFVAIMLALAVVCVIGAFVASREETWLSTQQTNFETRTNGIFDSI